MLKGYIPVCIPTKRYIKSYVLSQLGPQPLMHGRHNIGAKFYDLLSHTTNKEANRFSNVRYNAQLKLFVSYHTFYHRGAFLNETNIKNFNIFLEKEIKSRFYSEMDFYLRVHPSFTANLPAVRESLGIDVDSWECDSMQKDYYRYRKKTGKPMLYTSGGADHLFGIHHDPAF